MDERQRIILGIDPGTMILGYGVILVDRRRVHFVDMGVVDLRREKDHFAKLNTIFTEVSSIIDRYHPDDVAVEAPFYGKNPQVMLKLGRAQGAAISAAIAHGLPIFEYAPRKVKMAVTGQGAASKEQVAAIVTRTLKIDYTPRKFDETDGMAVALCHYYMSHNPLNDALGEERFKGLGGGRKAVSPRGSSSWEKFLREHPERKIEP